MLLCFSMVFSMLVQFAPAVQAEATQTETNIEITQDSEVSAGTEQGTDAALPVAIEEVEESATEEGVVEKSFSEPAMDAVVTPKQVVQRGGKAVFNKDTITLYLNHEDLTESQTVNLTDRGVVTLVDVPFVEVNGDKYCLLDMYEGSDTVVEDLINRWKDAYRWINVEDLDPYVEPDVEPDTPTDDEPGTEPDVNPDDETGDGSDTQPDEEPVVKPEAPKPELESYHTIEEVNRYGMFIPNSVAMLKQPVGASAFVNVETNTLPGAVYIDYIVTDTKYGGSWYVIQTGDNWPEEVTWPLVCVSVEAVELLEDSVSDVVDRLLGTIKVDQFEDIIDELIAEENNVLENIPEKVTAMLQDHYNKMVAAETVTMNGSVLINEVEVPVSVTGIIPQDQELTLDVSVVSWETLQQEKFDVSKPEDVIAALDIKLVYPDNTEWQPKEGRYITVEIGMAELGYQDGRIFRLHHKHGDNIAVFDIFIVMDGKLTYKTNGFSVYLVENFNPNNPSIDGVTNADRVAQPGGQITMKVGETKYFYADRNGLNEANPDLGTWQINDPIGAIYWEVYTNSDAGNGGVYAPWIKIVALKDTFDEEENVDEPLAINFVYRANNTNTTETYNLSIGKPQPQATDIDGYKLYIKDDVNETGDIVAMLVDINGNEARDEFGNIIAADPATKYTWTRSDDGIIMPMAYGENNRSVDITRDHSGLLQRRIENGVPDYVTYTLTVTLPSGIVKTAKYTVYYQSEIINASFESPMANLSDYYTYFVNGQAGLYWKASVPGTAGNLTKDIEYMREIASNMDGNGDSYPNIAADKEQFAEVNAEEFGALYQDIITVPGEELEWSFTHAARRPSWNASLGNRLFVIMASTEAAQKIGEDDIDDLIAAIRKVRPNNSAFANNQSVTVEFDPDGGINKDTYTVWFHDAGNTSQYNPGSENWDQNHNYGWTPISGKYTVPNITVLPNGTEKGQYRTRLFFLSESAAGQQANGGNVIDSTRAGLYKDYLIEYYEETYNRADSSMTYKYVGKKTKDDATLNHVAGQPLDQSGTEILYSSVELEDFDYFEVTEGDLLSTVLINGVNSPYSLKYAGHPALFIEKYSTTSRNVENKDPANNKLANGNPKTYDNCYKNYDIVMQVFFRDTVIAVQKKVEFPKILDANGNPVVETEGEGDNKVYKTTEAMTALEKQRLVDELIAANTKGYESHFHLTCNTPDLHKEGDPLAKGHFADESIYIAKNDPAGWYTGYIPFGENPGWGHKFTLEETTISELTGLELDSVQFKYYQFNQGSRVLRKNVIYGNWKSTGDPKVPVPTKIAEDVKIEINQQTGKKEVVGYNGETAVNVTVNEILIDETHKLAEIEVINTYREKNIKVNYVIAEGEGNITLANPSDAGGLYEQFLYYSGNPEGAVATQTVPGPQFAGWYLDEDCTMPVINGTHGYFASNGTFKPSKINAVDRAEINETTGDLEVTYYAKFSEAGIQIVRQNADPGQVFVYEVKRESTGEKMYVTIVADKDGNGSVLIKDVPLGVADKKESYTVTQITDWSWGYTSSYDGPKTSEHPNTQASTGSTTVFRFGAKADDTYENTLTGNSNRLHNIYGGNN